MSESRRAAEARRAQQRIAADKAAADRAWRRSMAQWSIETGRQQEAKRKAEGRELRPIPGFIS